MSEHLEEYRERTITVAKLCFLAGIDYGMAAGPERKVTLRFGGGHTRGPVRTNGRWDLVVDVAGMYADTPGRALQILEILAYQLDCDEAGESLVRARIGESLRNGRYQRRRTDTLQLVLTKLREMKDDLVTRGIIRAWVFGSVARGTDGPESDVDLVVASADGVQTFDIMDIEEMLSAVLNREVNIITREGLHPVRHVEIFRDMVEVF